MPSRLLSVAAVGLVVGTVLGVVGAFWIPLRIADVRAPLGPVLAPLLVVVACRAAGTRTGSRAAAAAPAIGWTVAVVVLAMRGPGGDVVVPGGDLIATGYLLGGAVAVTVGVAVGVPVVRTTPSSRPEQTEAAPPARTGR